MMLFHYSFMLPALIFCLLLAGIHTYFGYHIVQRGVIFVDLSLSQIAALGASVAILFGWGEQSPTLSFIVSLGFTLAGSVLFAFLRKSQTTAPMEALIGITYAGAIAISLLVLEKSATGTEHIKEMLVGTILTVSWRDVYQMGLLVFIIGLIHFFIRKKLFLISENPEQAEKQGIKVWWWDIVFYATFGIIVTYSVKIAGVLLIFSLLIIPAIAAMISTAGTGHRVFYGWIFGLIGCIAGLEISMRLDSAAGPSIITTLIVLLLLCSAVTPLVKKLKNI
ncbi:MAG TPA: metal ABC transporter permease [Chitinispirillaceae bacterium]|nr:metal ABC transporter permease [Chitinispirillaceae bacterium]